MYSSSMIIRTTHTNTQNINVHESRDIQVGDGGTFTAAYEYVLRTYGQNESEFLTAAVFGTSLVRTSASEVLSKEPNREKSGNSEL